VFDTPSFDELWDMEVLCRNFLDWKMLDAITRNLLYLREFRLATVATEKENWEPMIMTGEVLEIVRDGLPDVTSRGILKFGDVLDLVPK